MLRGELYSATWGTVLLRVNMFEQTKPAATNTDREAWLLNSKSAVEVLGKWQETINLIAELLAAPVGVIVQKNSNGFQLVVSSQTEANPFSADGYVFAHDAQLFCSKVLDEGHRLYVKKATKDEFLVVTPDGYDQEFHSFLGLPLRWPDGVLFGTICVLDHVATNYQEIYLRLIEKFITLVEADLKILDQYKTIQELSMRDHLTGLFNRNGFFTLGEQSLEMTQRLDKRYTVLFIDLDNLKVINDQFGHSSGDEALKTLANILQDRLRQADVIARIGGDEFAVLMVMDCMPNLKHVIQQIQYTIKKTGKIMAYPFSASIGHSGISGYSSTFLEEALRVADQDMYLCKTENHS